MVYALTDGTVGFQTVYTPYNLSDTTARHFPPHCAGR